MQSRTGSSPTPPGLVSSSVLPPSLSVIVSEPRGAIPLTPVVISTPGRSSAVHRSSTNDSFSSVSGPGSRPLTPVTQTVRVPFQFELSGGARFLVAFCVLNSLLGFLFARMFRTRSITFHLTAMHHGWNEDEKADACLRAAVGYIFAATLIVLNPFISYALGFASASACWCKAKNEVRTRCRRFVPKERLSLLGYSHKGSDESDADSDEMRSIRGGDRVPI